MLQQSAALTSVGDRPLIVVTAVAEADPGWVVAQEDLSDVSATRVLVAGLSAAEQDRILGRTAIEVYGLAV